LRKEFITLTAVTLLAMTTTTLTSALNYLVGYYTIPSRVNIYTLNIEAYWNEACTEQCTSINWGWLHPGDVKNVTIYIKNDGNVNVTLWLLTENWNPENASNYLNLTWNREGYLMTEEVADATLTLTVSNETTFDNATFDIIIKAVEAPSPPPPPGG